MDFQFRLFDFEQNQFICCTSRLFPERPSDVVAENFPQLVYFEGKVYCRTHKVGSNFIEYVEISVFDLSKSIADENWTLYSL